MELRLRQIRPGEGERLRDIRLRALREAPGAFASTFESESRRTDPEWEEAVRRWSSGDSSVTFVAEVEGRWVGIVAVRRQRASPRVAELLSMWVDPAIRRAGAGRQLVDEAVGWARRAGAEVVELWVASGNEAAAAFYALAGFAATGDRQPLPSDPNSEELRMVLHLCEQGDG